MEERDVETIATLKSDIKHINLSLANIHSSIEKLQGLMIEQYDLRKDVFNMLNEQKEMEKEFKDFKKEFSGVVENTKNNTKKIEELPKNLKVNIFDYLWKYLLIALGGWLVVEFTKLFPG